MKCPKCGYHSFEHLDNCKKCGIDLSDHKQKFNVRGFYVPGQVEVPVTEVAEAPEPEIATADDGAVDFGFDFLAEEDESGAPPVSTSPVAGEADDGLADAFEETAGAISGNDVSIQQPFGIDSETVPTEETPAEGENKKDPDSEFSF